MHYRRQRTHGTPYTDRDRLRKLYPGDDLVAYIPLTQGKVAIVDRCRYDELNRHKWYAMKSKNTWYARRKLRMSEEGYPGDIVMHQVVCPQWKMSDHKNRNGLDNREANLRPANHVQNAANSHQYESTSGYKGVHWSTQKGKWCAEICKGDTKVHLGFFTSKDDAAIVYNVAAQFIHGEYAYLNEIPDPPPDDPAVPEPRPAASPFAQKLIDFFEKRAVKKQKMQAVICGVRAATLRDWISGKRQPEKESVERVSRALAAIDRFLGVVPDVY